jgi:hypothetical protein
MSIEKSALEGVKRANKAQWVKPEIKIRVHACQIPRDGEGAPY